MNREERKKYMLPYKRIPPRAQMIETRVVDVYNPPRDRNHWVVILRNSNGAGKKIHRAWLSVYIHTQKPIGFGDTVFIDAEGGQVFLCHGGPLLYRLDTRCPMPNSVLQKVYEDIRVVSAIYRGEEK